MVEEIIQVKLVPASEDGAIVEAPQNVAEASGLIKGVIDEAGTNEEIPVPMVSKAILEKALVFCEHNLTHKLQEIPKPISHTNMNQLVDQWYADYIDI